MGMGTRILAAVVIVAIASANAGAGLELVGSCVTPHVQSPNLRYRRPPEPELGARVELFLRNAAESPLVIGPDFPARFDGSTPAELLERGDWAWHDTPSARPEIRVELPRGAIMVWRFNTRNQAWGIGSRHALDLGGRQEIALHLEEPKVWLSAVTFLGNGDSVHPTRVVVHLANESGRAVTVDRCRLWLPASNADFLSLQPRMWLSALARFPTDGLIPDGEKGGFTAETGPLPLTYACVEVVVRDPDEAETSLWAHLRIKREQFAISGGWVASDVDGRNTLTMEPYLKTLKRMHIDTGHIGRVPGYSDDPALYEKYPLKMFNRLRPVAEFDTDAMLPRIHAVEFLGEPQYGGGRPVPPQEVWAALAPYQSTRLPTTVTHSEERTWRFYAGLSDYPHYDAYRVTAPAADAWSLYDRWSDRRIRWGAPLETIGDLTRSQRDLNRPMPIAYWSQGAHAGWGQYGGRSRTSPTPGELRAQAYHALAQRITSLYWFNLNLKSLVKFRDLIEPITRVNREIRLMSPFLLTGDACEYRRLTQDGRPDWDLASVTGPEGGLFFALDLSYQPDLDERVFQFEGSRRGQFAFRLPTYLAAPAEVFRLDATGVHDVDFRIEGRELTIEDRITIAGIYVASANKGTRRQLENRYAALVQSEQAYGFDPAGCQDDFDRLKSLLATK